MNDLFPYRYRALIWQFARRDVLARYRGSLLGLAWSFLTPLLTLGVYTFVFREILKARWPTGDGSDLDFALRVYAGLIVFNLFSEVMVRAPALVTSQPNLVKKVVFPLQILPWVSVLAALFHVVLNLLVLIGAALVGGVAPSAALLALPLIVAAFVPFLLGLGWLLASLGVFVRDIGQATGMIISLLMFLSPIFYPASALPERWQPVLALNPLVRVIEDTRLVVLDGVWPDAGGLALYAAIGVAFAALAARWFALTRRGFADVL